MINVSVCGGACACACASGKFAKGVGSPHTKRGYVWHIGLTIQALTSTDPREIRDLIATCEVRSRFYATTTPGFPALVTSSVRCVSCVLVLKRRARTHRRGSCTSPSTPIFQTTSRGRTLPGPTRSSPSWCATSCPSSSSTHPPPTNRDYQPHMMSYEHTGIYGIYI